MRSDDIPVPDDDRPEPPGGHARRRLEQELSSRFGTGPDQPPVEPDDEPAGDRSDDAQDPDGSSP